MNKLKPVVVASLLASSLAFTSNAFAVQSIASNGVYLGAGLTPVTGFSHGSAAVDPGASLTLGYRINNHFAVEANYTPFFEPFVSGQIVDAAAKGFLPITPQFSAFGKLGVAYFRADADFNFWFIHTHVVKTEFAPEVGAGFNYNFTPNFAAELGVTAMPISNVVVVPATLGIRYTFG